MLSVLLATRIEPEPLKKIDWIGKFSCLFTEGRMYGTFPVGQLGKLRRLRSTLLSSQDCVTWTWDVMIQCRET
jgi:hypothetical protein